MTDPAPLPVVAAAPSPSAPASMTTAPAVPKPLSDLTAALGALPSTMPLLGESVDETRATLDKLQAIRTLVADPKIPSLPGPPDAKALAPLPLVELLPIPQTKAKLLGGSAEPEAKKVKLEETA